MEPYKYKLLFPVKSPHVPKKPELVELFKQLDRGENNTGKLPAGYTYFGQFMVHDVTAIDEGPPTRGNGAPHAIVDRVSSLTSPALDLDSVYGAGFSDSKVLFDKATGAFVLGPAGSKKDSDLPRDPTSLKARIGDSRNDENLLTAQMQVLFMRFHNRIIADLRRKGVRDRDKRFERAKREVIKVYQYLVLHDLLKRLVPDAVYKTVVLGGRGRLSRPNAAKPTIALEFADAACRLHSLVRASYTLNDSTPIDFGRLEKLTGNGRNTHFPLLSKRYVADWRHFFEFANYPRQRKLSQRANAISFVVNPFLRQVPEGRRPVNMLRKNLRKSIDHRLCTGQQACQKLRKQFRRLSKELGLQRMDPNNTVLAGLSPNNSIRTRTPLWLYLMLEADGKVGVLGGWIIADAIRTAVLNSNVRLRDLSNTRATELYEPLRRMARDRRGRPRAVTIEDVIMYTYKY